jgi:6-phosphogluconolactonase (cycloisomerase 2 family)
VTFFTGYTLADRTGEGHLFLLVGSYSDGSTPGISVYDFNIHTGDYSYISDIKQIVNPSYLAVSEDEQMIYSVNETKEGAVSAFRFDKAKGVLSFVNSQPVKSADPCYITVDKDRSFIVTANYSGGTISVFHLDTDGSIKPLTMINHNISTGYSPTPRPVPHKHTVVFSPDEKYLLVTDLGLDQIELYSVYPNVKEPHKLLSQRDITKLETGSGPRHLAFHPNGKYLYCINELSGKVAVFSYKEYLFFYKEYRLEAIQSIASDTTQTSRNKGSADIHLTSDGKFLYSSNRLRTDGIAIFSVDPENGLLTRIGYQSTGIHPRNFIISPNDKFLLCANRDTNNIQIFEIDPATGLLHDTGKEIRLDKPVCLKWIRK